jgi:hypothetical protein
MGDGALHFPKVYIQMLSYEIYYFEKCVINSRDVDTSFKNQLLKKKKKNLQTTGHLQYKLQCLKSNKVVPQITKI